jgi:hypothetical protein
MNVLGLISQLIIIETLRLTKTYVQFLRFGTLSSLIEFKHIVALTNETQTMLSFPKKFKFNV